MTARTWTVSSPIKTNAARLLDSLDIAYEAGMRGAQLILSPADYIRATGATLGPIAKPL